MKLSNRRCVGRVCRARWAIIISTSLFCVLLDALAHRGLDAEATRATGGKDRAPHIGQGDVSASPQTEPQLTTDADCTALFLNHVLGRFRFSSQIAFDGDATFTWQNESSRWKHFVFNKIYFTSLMYSKDSRYSLCLEIKTYPRKKKNLAHVDKVLSKVKPQNVTKVSLLTWTFFQRIAKILPLLLYKNKCFAKRMESGGLTWKTLGSYERTLLSPL